jgi:hypothetical protein
MGFSRDTFYRYQTARDAGGVEALFEVSRRKPNLKNRVDEATESAVTAFAIDFPAYGQVRASNELRKQGVFVSPSGVRSIWLRQTVPAYKEPADKLLELEAAVSRHDESIGLMLEALRNMIPAPVSEKRRIGFRHSVTLTSSPP